MSWSGKMTTVNISIADIEYDVCIARDLKSKISRYLSEVTKNKKVLMVTDEYFELRYARKLKFSLEEYGFDVQLYVIPGGKSSKSFNVALKIYGVLETENYARDSTLIALGGGVIGDLAGFVASTWYRGMNLLHVPTTLMGMVDSSIGGKVAINFRNTINAVGNYYHPIANYMDIDHIDALPERDYISGLAEVVKCGLIADNELLNYLTINHLPILARESDHLIHCIKRSIEIKVDHVKNDVKEGGKRLLLNYGHTLGHAIEMATHTDQGETFRHGEGVSLGICAVLLLAEEHLGFSSSDSKYVRSLLQLLRLPVDFSAAGIGYTRESLIDKCMRLMLKDKKRKDNSLRFILVDKLGHANTYVGLDDAKIYRAFKSVIKE
jgi:3-dehydroquinate synthase